MTTFESTSGAMKRIQEADDGFSADAMGMIAWGVFGGISVFNFLYFADLYYVRYTTSRYHSFGLAFQNTWGATVWLRTFFHVVVSFIMMFMWMLTFFPWSGFWYAFYYVAVYGYSLYFFVTRFFLILTQVIAMGTDGGEYDHYKYYDYFQEQNGMGHEQTDSAEELQWEEYYLESANVLAICVGAPMFSAGMKFWYFDQDAEREARMIEEHPTTRPVNERIMDVSDALFHF